MSSEVCNDDRFELVGKAKAKLLEATNIEMRPDEMAVIDSILFRCWQMGWLDKLRDTEAEAIEAWNSRAERTCFADEVTHRDCKYSVNRGWRERTCRIKGRYGNQYCTYCGEMIGTWDPESELYISGNMVELWNYCPNCGAKVIGGDAE